MSRHETGGSAMTMTRVTSVGVGGAFGRDGLYPCSATPQELEAEARPPLSRPPSPNLLSNSPLPHASIRILSSYVPALILRQVAGRPAASFEPRAECLRGAVLFAD